MPSFRFAGFRPTKRGRMSTKDSESWPFYNSNGKSAKSLGFAWLQGKHCLKLL